MVSVHSQAELKAAMDRKEKQIRIVGPYAKELYDKMQKKKKVKKGAVIAGGALAVGGILAAPFTGGTSLAGTATGLAMAGATIGAITLTAGELAMILGSATLVSMYAIYKGAKIKFSVNKQTGEVTGEIDAKK